MKKYLIKVVTEIHRFIWGECQGIVRYRSTPTSVVKPMVCINNRTSVYRGISIIFICNDYLSHVKHLYSYYVLFEEYFHHQTLFLKHKADC